MVTGDNGGGGANPQQLLATCSRHHPTRPAGSGDPSCPTTVLHLSRDSPSLSRMQVTAHRQTPSFRTRPRSPPPISSSELRHLCRQQVPPLAAVGVDEETYKIDPTDISISALCGTEWERSPSDQTATDGDTPLPALEENHTVEEDSGPSGVSQNFSSEPVELSTSVPLLPQVCSSPLSFTSPTLSFDSSLFSCRLNSESPVQELLASRNVESGGLEMGKGKPEGAVYVAEDDADPFFSAPSRSQSSSLELTAPQPAPSLQPTASPTPLIPSNTVHAVLPTTTTPIVDPLAFQDHPSIQPIVQLSTKPIQVKLVATLSKKPGDEDSDDELLLKGFRPIAFDSTHSKDRPPNAITFVLSLSEDANPQLGRRLSTSAIDDQLRGKACDTETSVRFPKVVHRRSPLESPFPRETPTPSYQPSSGRRTSTEGVNTDTDYNSIDSERLLLLPPANGGNGQPPHTFLPHPLPSCRLDAILQVTSARYAPCPATTYRPVANTFGTRRRGVVTTLSSLPAANSGGLAMDDGDGDEESEEDSEEDCKSYWDEDEES